MDFATLLLLMVMIGLSAFFFGVWAVSFLVRLSDREFERYFRIKKL